MDGLSDTASLIAVLQLAAVAIKYVKNVIGAPVQKRRLLIMLVQARGMLTALLDLTNEVEDEDWSQTIQNLVVPNGPLSTFQDLLEQIVGKLGIATPNSNFETALSRLRWPFDQASLHDMIASLEQLKSQFLLAIANDHVRLSMTIHNQLHEVQNQLTKATIDTRRQAIVSLSKEQELIVNSLSLANLSRKVKGEDIMKMRASTEWFFRHSRFKQWHDACPTPTTLVLTGLPGSGKTSLCQVTQLFLRAWHQSDIDVCVAYFAFDFSRREKLDKSLVLSNIVQQMVLERPYLMEHVAALRVTGGPLSPIDSIDLLRRARRDLKQFYLIIDGLDEGGSIGIAIIQDLLAVEPPLSMLITTRHSLEVVTALHDHPSLNMDHAAKFPGDLEAVTKILENDHRLAGYLDHDHKNISFAAKVIVEQSQGL